MPTDRKAAKTLGSSRVIHLHGEINEKSGREVINRLIGLDKKSNKDILLIIDTIGGDIDTLISIYQIIKLLRCDVATLALSNANSAGAVLLACGKNGKRMVMPESIIMLHDMSTELSNDYHNVLENEIKSIRISKKVISQMLTEHGASSSIKLLKPEATYMLGEEAIKHGLVDKVIKNFDEVLKVANI